MCDATVYQASSTILNAIILNAYSGLMSINNKAVINIAPYSINNNAAVSRTYYVRTRDAMS